MAKLYIQEETLTDIGDAIREKTGTTAAIPLVDFATTIADIPTGGDLPAEAFSVTGSCQYRFANGWEWFIDNYGRRITTSNITDANYMFYKSTITNIPFSLNFKTQANGNNLQYFLQYCKTETLPALNNLKLSQYSQNLFDNAQYLKRIDDDKVQNIDWSAVNASVYGYSYNTFYCCYRLQYISPIFLKNCYSKGTQSYYAPYGSKFYSCYCLGEVEDLAVQPATLTSNCFDSAMVGNCYRLKKFTFNTNDGTPITANWKNQIIDMYSNAGSSSGLGYTANNLVSYGMNASKKIYDQTSYEALKDDPDAWVSSMVYARYNRTSAVETINSLPDTSAYLAANGGTNTIKFKGTAGANTDGGAINTMTDAEIAVAAAKGWTVTLT